ncbi:MAG: NOL1/NOP2/sun family putative RNA methylase [Nanoarchaeota archaeon]|nr:NOL1/NOP2/sun family putative RNA methylase [Nanoarchaeota archaeon]
MEEMKDAQEIKFKDRFVNRYSKLTDWDTFRKVSLTYLRRSVRINTLKKSVEEVKESLAKKGWILTPIPWCKEGFWVEHVEGRRDIGNTDEHCLGYIYVQEAASMIPPVVLGAKPGEMVLDMCAAPGSKSSQIAQNMNNEGVLVSNDFQGIRLAPLGINMQRSGVRNVVVTLMQGQWFKDLEFDRILVDAPCSGTGTIRKSLKTLRIWNETMVKRLSGTQKHLLDTAFNNLKKGGTIVYSTCSLEPEEDEGVVDFLITKYDNAKIEEIDLDIKRSPAVTSFDGKEYSPEVKKCLRIWPQDNDTEGFFVCKIRKL